MSTGFDFFFKTLFPVIFIIVAVAIISVIAYTIVSSVRTWNKNEASPQLSVDAVVVGKRTHTHHSDPTKNAPATSYSQYYVTFEFESSDRLELQVKGKEYGLIAEGDCGILRFQGSRYLGFDRGKKKPV